MAPPALIIHHEIRKIGETALYGQAEIEEFGRLAMKPDSAQANAYFLKMRERGHSIDSLFVDFLAPTARHLGELWEQDRVDFIDVTLGVARLHELLEMFGLAEEIVGDDLRHRAILIAPIFSWRWWPSFRAMRRGRRVSVRGPVAPKPASGSSDAIFWSIAPSGGLVCNDLIGLGAAFAVSASIQAH